MLPEDRGKKVKQLNSQLIQAGIIGSLKGTLIGVLSGLYINYRYNRAHNTKFFSTTFKFGYVFSWLLAGLIFETDIEKSKISKQIAIDEEIKKNMYINDEYSELSKSVKRQ